MKSYVAVLTIEQIVGQIFAAPTYEILENNGSEHHCELCGKPPVGPNGKLMAYISIPKPGQSLLEWKDDRTTGESIILDPDCLTEIKIELNKYFFSFSVSRA